MNFRWFFVSFFVCFIAHLLSFLPFFFHPDFFSCFFTYYLTTPNSCLVKGRRICSGSHFIHASPRSGSGSISVSHYGFFSCLCLYRSGYVISAPPPAPFVIMPELEVVFAPPLPCRRSTSYHPQSPRCWRCRLPPLFPSPGCNRWRGGVTDARMLEAYFVGKWGGKPVYSRTP